MFAHKYLNGQIYVPNDNETKDIEIEGTKEPIEYVYTSVLYGLYQS